MLFYYLKSGIGFMVTQAIDALVLAQANYKAIDMMHQNLLHAATAHSMEIITQQRWTRYAVVLRGDPITKDDTSPSGLSRAYQSGTPMVYELHGTVYEGLPDWPVAVMPETLRRQYRHHPIASVCGKFGDGIASKDEILFWPHTRTLPTM
jgi:hypothetical protein